MTFTTVRPADYATPYDAMVKHGVQVMAVERQQSMLSTIGVRPPRCIGHALQITAAP